MRKPKIVFIGAGSMSFGASMFRDIFNCPDLAGATLSLVDIDAENLERMYNLAVKLNEVTGLGIKLEQSMERRDLLPGADFVVTSIAIERCDLWKQDFNVPKKYGIKHCLGENGGPGALFFTLRTIPVIMDIMRDMEELCPDAHYLNFSNPETRIVLAVSKYSKIKSMGLCHGIFMGHGDVAKILDRNYDDIEVLGAGMNHFQWMLSIRDKATGEDLYPEFREREKSFRPDFMPYSRKMFNAFGLWPTCSDDHLGEYQAYGWEAGQHGYDFDGDAQDRVRMKAEIKKLTGGELDVKEWIHPSGEQAVEVICSIFFNKRKYIDAGIVYNDGCITNLPKDIAVEVPVIVDGSGIHKVHIGEMPLAIKNLLNMQVGPQQLSVEAAVRGSKEIALQALLCDPVINSYDAAVKLLDELWEINKPYIRPVI
jgi:alpha-galactosidase